MDMKSISLYSKINLLPESLKKEVSDFIDFLVAKSKDVEKMKNSKARDSNTDLKSLLLRGPVFNDHQIEKVVEARKHINKWRRE